MVSGLTVLGLFHGDTLIFDYHFIFNLFEVLLNYVILFYIYTWILLIKSTLLMSLDVGKSRIVTMRGLTKSRTKRPLRARGANGLVFLACKLNLPLVPSQDYVLQDNKRCYDTILSDWNFSKTKSNNNNLCILRTKCSPSQTYDTG